MSEIEQQRKIRHRLAVVRHAQEVTGSVSKTCGYLRDQPADVRQVAAPLRSTR